MTKEKRAEVKAQFDFIPGIEAFTDAQLEKLTVTVLATVGLTVAEANEAAEKAETARMKGKIDAYESAVAPLLSDLETHAKRIANQLADLQVTHGLAANRAISKYRGMSVVLRVDETPDNRGSVAVRSGLFGGTIKDGSDLIHRTPTAEEQAVIDAADLAAAEEAAKLAAIKRTEEVAAKKAAEAEEKKTGKKAPASV